MADSTTNLDLISASQAQKEVTANALFDAMSPGGAFGRRASTSSGLVWGYYGGVVSVSGVPTAVANGTKTLTASTTNYLYLNASGAVTLSTTEPTGWPGAGGACALALYEIVVGANAPTSWEDLRCVFSI